MKLKEKEPVIVIVIRNGCFKGSDQIRRIPSVQSKMHHISYFCSKAVLTCILIPCFERKYEKISNISSEMFLSLPLKKSLHIARGSFRNG